jgi:hypothetical protein
MRSSRYILFVLAVVIILGVNVVHAADVIFENGLAIRVENLEIGGTSYTAEFAVQSTANEAYGPFPGVYTFNDEGAATEARNELLMALNAAGAPLLGTPGVSVDGQSFAIGYEGAVILLIESVKTTRAALEGTSQTYIPLEPNPWEYNFQWKNYVVFSPGGGGGCSYTIDPTTASVPYTGGTGTIAVTTQAGCEWTATSNVDWVTVTSGGSGTGSGTVGYSVDHNPSVYERTGKIQGSNKVFTITQDGDAAPAGLIFWDDFESGDTSWWSETIFE